MIEKLKEKYERAIKDVKNNPNDDNINILIDLALNFQLDRLIDEARAICENQHLGLQYLVNTNKLEFVDKIANMKKSDEK